MAHPSIRIRQAAVQPQPRRLHCAAGKNDDVCVLCEQLTARTNPPGDATRDERRISADTNGKCVWYESDWPAVARPQIAGQRHRNVADSSRSFGLQIDWRTQWLETTLRAVATERAPLRARKYQAGGIAGSAR